MQIRAYYIILGWRKFWNYWLVCVVVGVKSLRVFGCDAVLFDGGM
jgi:hypothetical protein